MFGVRRFNDTFEFFQGAAKEIVFLLRSLKIGILPHKNHYLYRFVMQAWY